jgi:hypothetical protein
MSWCLACENDQHDKCFMSGCHCPCAGEAEDYFERDLRDEEES